MFLNRLILLIVGIITFATYFVTRNRKVKENFAGMGVSFKVKADPVAEVKNQMFSIPGTYQSMLSPRFSALNDYGAFIRYNMPSKSMQGVPTNPLGYADLVKKENFKNVREPYMYMGPTGVAPDYAAGNYNQLESNLKYTETTDLLPAADMNNLSVSLGADGSMGGNDMVQPITYDRFIYANQKSRLYGRGDMFRGDLPITPMKGQWFVPSVQPQIDLTQGAMMVMGGSNNDTSKETLRLMTASSGNTLQAYGGVPYTMAIGSQKDVGLSAGNGDIMVTAFP